MPSIQKVSNAYQAHLPNREQHALDNYDRDDTSSDKKSKKSFKDILKETQLKRPVPSR